MDIRSERIFEANREKILQRATTAFGTAPGKLKRLGSFESVVYEFGRGENEFILKLTHSIHRTPEEVLGELEWVNYLADGCIPVAPAVTSVKGNLTEVIDIEDSYFIAYAFEKAEGQRAEVSTWDDALITKWGRMVGKMHSRTRTFTPSRKPLKRKQWYEDPYRDFDSFVPSMQTGVLEACRRHMAHLKALPTDRDSYGLIHSDLHHGNFFVNDGSLTVIDFDDCQYSWFAFDIAIPLFYALTDSAVGYDNKEFARNFLGKFLSGYTQEFVLDEKWIRRLPDFLKLREMEIYGILIVDPMESMNEWCLRLLKDRRKRIENDVPFIDIDFSEFA